MLILMGLLSLSLASLEHVSDNIHANDERFSASPVLTITVRFYLHGDGTPKRCDFVEAKWQPYIPDDYVPRDQCQSAMFMSRNKSFKNDNGKPYKTFTYRVAKIKN